MVCVLNKNCTESRDLSPVRLVLFIALFTLFLTPGAVIAEGPDERVNQETFEFAFMIFEEFRITPEIGVVYPPIFAEQFGIPVRSEKGESGTRDPTYRVVRETLYYDGLELTIVRGVDSAPSDWTWLERVYITDSKYELRTGLRIGDKLELFLERLRPHLDYRKPGSKQVSFYSGGYGEPGGVTHAAHATVTLLVDEGEMVQSVAIDYWAD
jgi:hypothetical protein